jgi:hypothetical protein
VTYRELYLRYWNELERYRASIPSLSPPLLVEPPDKYWTQAVRLCVVGQETHSWYDEPFGIRTGAAAVDYLLGVYREFALGTRYVSPFWRSVRYLEAALGIERGAVVWTNLNKVDQDQRRPIPAVEKAVGALFPVVPEELSLAKAHAVVFFTGPRYDDLLRRLFAGSSLTSAGPYIARVSNHPQLPACAYRTYHPAFLSRKKVLERVIDDLAREIQRRAL